MRVDVGATLRNLAGPVVARALRVEVRGAHRVPRRGPLVVACQDGDEGTRWILRSLLPRPVHVVPGDEGPAIDVQFDAVSRLAEGQAVAFAGAHPAPGFTALASGAPVLPADIATDPVSGQRTLFLGDPHDLPATLAGADPASLASARASSEWVRQLVADFATDVRRRVPV